MKTVNIYEAKTRLSALVEEAIAGEDVIIAKAGKALVRLVPVNKGGAKFKFGFLKGKLEVSDDFDEPLPPEILRDFEGK
jgi:prevent-host-death family protein